MWTPYAVVAIIGALLLASFVPRIHQAVAYGAAWVFGADPNTRHVVCGTQQGYSTLTWLLGIITGQGLTFAASLQYQGSPWVPISGYMLVSGLMLVGVGLLLNARATSGSSVRVFDHGTLVFGRWVQGALITLATVSVVASLFGAIPGQRQKRKPYSQDLVPCTVQAAGDMLAGEGQGVGAIQAALDLASLDRWKTWVARANLSDNQRMVYVQTTAFDAGYLPFQVLIDFENANVAFDDAFVLLVRNAPPDSVNPPIFRILGLPQQFGDAGRAAAQQVPLPMKMDSTHLPVFSVPGCDQGDILVLFVIFTKATDQSILPPLSDERSLFLKLKRVN